ncbi:uncharacterized protein LOC132544457 [Ylistrum balloti]|uniref:uncharacterized protein LOC132544457 n=1 Tax=Ylistrum balloti TaxID=509963 RepID=UPI0029058112|nr:uncharacterized protein LOC132544457 [Ylistrum balloti]
MIVQIGMELKGWTNFFYLLVMYNIFCNVSSLPYCKDQWRKNLSVNVSATGTCKIEQKAGTAVDLYCDVDLFSSISWYHKFHGKWVPIVMENNSEWEQTVYLSKRNKHLTLLRTYIDEENDGDYGMFTYNKNSNGTYKCIAHLDSDLPKTLYIQLDLYDCAKRKNVLIHLTMKEERTDLGETVKSSCVADYGCQSAGPYSADWYLRRGSNYMKIADLQGTRYNVKTTTRNAGRLIVTNLTIHDVQKEDFGDHFVCIVMNSTVTNVTRHLHIKRVDVVEKRLPFPIIQAMIVLCVVFIIVILVYVFSVTWKHKNIGLYIKSRYFDTRQQNNNRIFILLDDEEEGSFEDRDLAEDIIREFEKSYKVDTSYTLSKPGHPTLESQNPFEGSSTHFIILPDLSDEKRFKEIDQCVHRLLNNKEISPRYLTVIDRRKEEMNSVPPELKNAFLFSKLLAHVKRPEKQDTEKQKSVFFSKLKKRTSPLPKEKKYEEDHAHFTCQVCCCSRDKCHQIYSQDNVNLVNNEHLNLP